MFPRLPLLAALVLAPIGALAQPAPPADPGLAACAELLGEANRRVVGLAAQNAKLQAELKAAQDALAKAAKPAAEP